MSVDGIWDDNELLNDCDHEIKYKNGNVYIGEAFIYNANIDNLCPDGIGTLTFNCSNSNIAIQALSLSQVPSGCSRCNTVFPKFEVFQIIGTWQEGYIASDYDYKVIYKTGEIYIGKVNEYNVNNRVFREIPQPSVSPAAPHQEQAVLGAAENDTIFPNGRGKMIFNSFDSIILNIIGTWQNGCIVNIETIVYNTQKIELQSELNHCIRDAAYLPITDEKSVLGKRFREAGKNFNERNGIVC